MTTKIRLMQEKDRQAVLDMMQEFYSSEAVFTNGSKEIFNADITNCVNASPYLEGYILEDEGKIQGYTMLAKSFSTEFGKPCIWVEDIFIKKEYRGLGLGTEFLAFIEQKYSDCIFRLEAEAENKRAIGVYKKCGYTALPYIELKK